MTLMMLPTRLKFNGQILFKNLQKKLKKKFISIPNHLFTFFGRILCDFWRIFNQNLTICVQQGEKQQHWRKYTID